jgi:acetate CoA/acetoacetate CoA-transferase beta subunit
MCVIKPTDEGLVLKEIASDYTIDDVKNNTAADLIIPEDVKIMGE